MAPRPLVPSVSDLSGPLMAGIRDAYPTAEKHFDTGRWSNVKDGLVAIGVTLRRALAEELRAARLATAVGQELTEEASGRWGVERSDAARRAVGEVTLLRRLVHYEASEASYITTAAEAVDFPSLALAWTEFCQEYEAHRVSVWNGRYGAHVAAQAQNGLELKASAPTSTMRMGNQPRGTTYLRGTVADTTSDYTQTFRDSLAHALLELGLHFASGSDTPYPGTASVSPYAHGFTETRFADTLALQVVSGAFPPGVLTQSEAFLVTSLMPFFDVVDSVVTEASVNTGTDILTYSGWDWPDGTYVKIFSRNGDTPPTITGVPDPWNTNFYTLRQSSTESKLSLTQGGAALNITAAGSQPVLIAKADVWTELTAASRQSILRCVNYLRTILKSHMAAGASSGYIPTGHRFTVQADAQLDPPQKQATFEALAGVGVITGQEDVTVRVRAVAPGRDSNIPQTAPARSLVVLPDALFDADAAYPLSVTAIAAAGGASGVTDVDLRRAARGAWATRGGPTNGAVSGSAMAESLVSRCPVLADLATGDAYAYPVDEDWATSAEYRATMLSQLAANDSRGFGLSLLGGEVETVNIRVSATAQLRSVDLAAWTGAIERAIQGAVADYFDRDGDWYLWSTSALKSIVSRADPRILKCTDVRVHGVSPNGFQSATNPDWITQCGPAVPGEVIYRWRLTSPVDVVFAVPTPPVPE